MNKTKTYAIYQPSGAAAEYSTWACNLYNGCIHSCTYCYCKRGVFAHTLGKNHPEIQAQLGGNPESAFDIYSKELDRYRDQIIADGGLFFSFSTDPMLREEINLTLCCIEYAFSQQVPVIILTKATWWVREDWVMGTLYAHRDLLTIGLTLTGHDELELGAPANVSRQTAIVYLHKLGFRTFASMEPVIHFADSLAIIRTIASDCDEFRIGLLSPYSKKRYNSAQCERFVSNICQLQKEHGFRVLWKESIRRFCRDWSICPEITNE